MQRRGLIAFLGGAAVSWPLIARAKQGARLPTVGFLASGTAASHGRYLTAFVQRLHELGWNEGQSVVIEVRWAEGRRERAAQIAAEFVRLKVNVMITAGTPTTLAARQATAVIPIVFVSANDPVGTGLVENLARPGGNVTGLSNETRDLAGKRLEFLRQLLPNLRRLGILVNIGNPAAALETHDVQTAAGTLGLEVVMLEIRSAEDIAAAFETTNARLEAVYVLGDLLTMSNRITINTWALRARLPTSYAFREDVEAGGLISYGPSSSDLYRRAADYVDKILHGAKPSDIPVEQPTKFDLVINLTTAKALGLEVPPSLLATADEVIE